MSDASFFKTTYTPDYGDLFAVSMASRRYHYSSRQRWIVWLPFLGYFGFLLAMLAWGDDWVTLAALAVLPPVAARWAPLALVVAVGLLFVWFYSYRLIPALSARWITRRKPLEPTSFSADRETLRWEAAESGTWIKWAGIERMFVTHAAVCFLHGGVTLHLPRRLFVDGQALAAFVEQCLVCLPEKARHLSEADASVQAGRKA